MNFSEYDQLQMDLGAVSTTFNSNMQKVLADSNADPQTKELVENACKNVSQALTDLSILTSRLARLMVN